LTLDKDLVKSANIPFKSIFTGKFRRYFSWRNFIDPIFVLLGILQSFWIIITFWPNVVFVKGGFVSLPVALAAFVLRRPIILHESDSVMGLANRMIAKLATKICVSFPGLQSLSQYSQSKIVFTGNPVRASILGGESKKGYEITGFRTQKPIVLVWGGSQGALEINSIIEESFSHLKSIFQVIHITGRGKKTEIHDESYIQFKYLNEELKHIYAIVDFVVGRAGANSLYELALIQKPNIIIPLKNSAHNHQQLNAEYFEREGGSLILRGQLLHEVLMALWNNLEKQKSMKEALGRISRPNAVNDMVKLILSV